MNYEYIFGLFLPYGSLYGNSEDALLREDEKGTPESGENTAPSQCNELMALLASLNKTVAAIINYMASIGLKDAYYSVPIHPFHKNI